VTLELPVAELALDVLRLPALEQEPAAEGGHHERPEQDSERRARVDLKRRDRDREAEGHEGHEEICPTGQHAGGWRLSGAIVWVTESVICGFTVAVL
jgi:hypothetical protein